MPDLIDGDALRAYLRESLSTFRVMAGHMEPGTDGNARVAGAILALEQVQKEVVAGRFSPSADPRRPARERVRRADPETSKAAARSITADSELHHQIVGLLYRSVPLTDEEICTRLLAQGIRCTPSGVRSRRSELVDAGIVKDSGQRGTTVAGRESIRWALATPEFSS